MVLGKVGEEWRERGRSFLSFAMHLPEIMLVLRCERVEGGDVHRR
jgi:hypothetical protein